MEVREMSDYDWIFGGDPRVGRTDGDWTGRTPETMDFFSGRKQINENWNGEESEKAEEMGRKHFLLETIDRGVDRHDLRLGTTEHERKTDLRVRHHARPHPGCSDVDDGTLGGRPA
jgi:hypothetical protein